MVDKTKLKEGVKKATKWTFSKLWQTTKATSQYLWDGSKMVVEDIARKKQNKRPKKRNLKARLKQGAAIGSAIGALIFGGAKTVQHYRDKDVNQRYEEFSNSIDYLFKKNGYPIDPKSPVWNTSNKDVSKLTQQELNDRQQFLSYIESYLKKFAHLRTSLDPDKLLDPLKVQEQRKFMESFMGSDLIEKGEMAQRDPSKLKDYQICSQAANVAIAIIAKAQGQKSEYAVFDFVKEELKKLSILKGSLKEKKVAHLSSITRSQPKVR